MPAYPKLGTRRGFLNSEIPKFTGGSVDKESTCKARYTDLIPGWGRSSGEENGNPLQYFCLGNPMDRRAWQATVHRVAKELDTTWRLNHHHHIKRDMASVSISQTPSWGLGNGLCLAASGSFDRSDAEGISFKIDELGEEARGK